MGSALSRHRLRPRGQSGQHSHSTSLAGKVTKPRPRHVARMIAEFRGAAARPRIKARLHGHQRGMRHPVDLLPLAGPVFVLAASMMNCARILS